MTDYETLLAACDASEAGAIDRMRPHSGRNQERYHGRWWNHFGRIALARTTEEWRREHVDDQRPDGHDPGDEDRRWMDGLPTGGHP